MRKVSSFSIGALAVLLLTVLLLGCGGGRSAPTGSNLKSMPAGRTIDLNEALAELDALQAPEGVDATLFASLKDSLRGGLINRGKIVLTPSVHEVNDFIEVTPVTVPPSVNWSCNFFVADGSLSGMVGVEDVTPIAMYWQQQPSVNPLAMVADYNRDDIVSIADITTLAMTFGQSTAGYTIEYSPTGAGTWSISGTVDWADFDATNNANGFHQWTYQFPAGQLTDGDWDVRITPWDNGTPAVLGVANTPIVITVGGGPVSDFIVTGMRVTATGTTNTDAGDPDNVGTERYVAPAGGGDTMGEALANNVVLIDLDKVSYTWKGNPFDYDDPLPADLTQTDYDNYIADLKTYMTYAVTSLRTPADPEAWDASATQPPTGYEGRLGPNDDLVPPNQDAVLIAAHMSDNDMTQGAATFDVTVQVDLLVDPNAPVIFNHAPDTQPQNVTQINTVRCHWGADEVGDELPQTVALYDRATGLVAFVFNPATVVETMAPPDNAGEYTLSRVTGIPEFTVILQVKVAASLLDQSVNYVWRVSEDASGFELKSSLRKPGTWLDIVGPQMFDMNTWPEDEFYQEDTRAPYLYFVPQDPMIRRNPIGHRDASTPPEFVYDDPVASTDLVKAAGGEFMIIYGVLPDPDSPVMYYKLGSSAPATIAEADGQMPIMYRQPHLLAGLAGAVPATPGDVSFSMFNKEGTLLGSVTRILGNMMITRGPPVISDGDFGVRPWGAAGDAVTPDFSDKAASIGNMDVIVFTFYNLWLRHDDGTGLTQAQRGTHLILYDTVNLADLADMCLRAAILSSDYNGALCYTVLDAGNPDWWQNISQDIPIGAYNVQLETPGAGRVTYYEADGITPKVLNIVP